MEDLHFENSSTGWCVGQSGTILKTTDGGGLTGIISQTNEVPREFSLSQNYPNPFNPETTIKFSLTNSTDVKLAVYDLQGNEAEILINSFMHAGTYKTIFDGSKLASGVYFYRIKTGSFTAVRKMVLVK